MCSICLCFGTVTISFRGPWPFSCLPQIGGGLGFGSDLWAQCGLRGVTAFVHMDRRGPRNGLSGNGAPVRRAEATGYTTAETRARQRRLTAPLCHAVLSLPSRLPRSLPPLPPPLPAIPSAAPSATGLTLRSGSGCYPCGTTGKRGTLVRNTSAWRSSTSASATAWSS